MARVIGHLVAEYGIDAVMMHDMDFFISEARVAEFSERIAPLDIKWWALGRIDTLMHYSDATWRAMARAGLKMVFSGAESASDEVLATMNKGGQASPRLTIELAGRMKSYGVVPEYSFVLGSPPDPIGDMARTFEFIRKIKRVNPATEIVLYTYTPVPMDGTMYQEASRLGFAFPKTLDEWASDEWRQAMMRRGDGMPWTAASGGAFRVNERDLRLSWSSGTRWSLSTALAARGVMVQIVQAGPTLLRVLGVRGRTVWNCNPNCNRSPGHVATTSRRRAETCSLPARLRCRSCYCPAESPLESFGTSEPRAWI